MASAGRYVGLPKIRNMKNEKESVILNQKLQGQT